MNGNTNHQRTFPCAVADTYAHPEISSRRLGLLSVSSLMAANKLSADLQAASTIGFRGRDHPVHASAVRSRSDSGQIGRAAS